MFCCNLHNKKSYRFDNTTSFQISKRKVLNSSRLFETKNHSKRKVQVVTCLSLNVTKTMFKPEIAEPNAYKTIGHYNPSTIKNSKQV